MWPNWNESRGKNPLRCQERGCQLLVPAASVPAVAPAPAPRVLEGPEKAELHRVAHQSLVPKGGCCAAARGRMKLKKADGCPGQLILQHLFPSPHRDSTKAGYPVLVSPLPAAFFSPCTANTHRNICSEGPKQNSLSPHPLCSDRQQNCALSYITEPQHLLYSQGTVLRIMARASVYQ